MNDSAKITVLNVGWLSAPAGVVRAGDPMTEKLRFPVSAYVLEVGDEKVLVDTGLHPGVVLDSVRHYGTPDVTGIWDFEQSASIADQVDLKSLTMVVLTHLHFDHAGGLSLIPEGVPLVIQRDEWLAGNDSLTIAANFFLPRDYEIGDRELILIDGDHDLLGDGIIQLLATPGHTPGHQSVNVGDIVLAADAIHFASGLDDEKFPVFGDHDRQRDSLARLRRLRDEGATLVIGHDPDHSQPRTIHAFRGA